MKRALWILLLSAAGWAQEQEISLRDAVHLAARSVIYPKQQIRTFENLVGRVASTLTPPVVARVPYCATRHGDRSRQPFSASFTQAVVLSLWQRLQAFGTFSESVSSGVMKRKVWLRTFTSAMVCSIFGM